MKKPKYKNINRITDYMTPFALEIINDHGIVFDEVQVLPKDIARGKVGECFDHCAIQAILSRGKYQYVEGYVYSPVSDDWLHHAWLTKAGVSRDAEKHVGYDPTWKALDAKGGEHPMHHAGFIYVGVPADTKKMIKFVKATNRLAAFENYKKNQKLAREMFV